MYKRTGFPIPNSHLCIAWGIKEQSESIFIENRLFLFGISASLHPYLMKKHDKKLFFSMTYEFLEIYMRVQLERSPATIKSYRDVALLIVFDGSFAGKNHFLCGNVFRTRVS